MGFCLVTRYSLLIACYLLLVAVHYRDGGNSHPVCGMRDRMKVTIMAVKTAKGKGAASASQVPAATLDRIAQEIAARRRPMTLAELLELTQQ